MNNPEEGRGLGRFIVALLLGLLGSLIVWVATPYNNWVMRGQLIADDYLPVVVVFLLLLLVLVVNPLLRRFAARFALTTRQLALIFGIMLVASVVASSGMHRMLPYAIASIPLDVRESAELAEAYEKMNLPPSLFPDKLGYRREVPASEHFIRKLPPGETIPWGAWVGPLLSWGTFTVLGWLMMIGLALIVLPQWRRNERLPFPLLSLERSLIETPEEGRLFAPLFRKKSFWIAAGLVFLIHLLLGLKTYYPESVPAVSLRWDLGSMFADTFLRHLPGHIRGARIYFIFFGITFFMPDRIGFSIWFVQLAYALHVAIQNEYAPPFHYGTLYEHRFGSMFAVAAFIVWLGRKHWLHVFRCIFRASSEEERKDRQAGLMFSAGCVGMYLWLLWVGVLWYWALFYVGIAFMVSLLITRIVAETGLPYIRIDFRYTLSMVKLAPMSFLSAVSLYFASVMAMFFPMASRVSGTTMATHAMGLDEDAPPRHQARLAWFFVVLLAAGFIICGAVTLHANYHHSVSLDGIDQPLSPWGTTRISGKAHPDILAWNAGRVDRPVYNQAAHLTFGAVLAALLQWACLAMPRWPIHPVGLIMNGTYYANEAWASILFGWLVKVLLVKYGGARLYRAARATFLGLIMGEIFAGVFWSIEPVVRVLLGLPFKIVEVLPR